MAFASYVYFFMLPRILLTKVQKCIECPDFDVCESCQAITDEQHPNHSFVKISKLNDLVYRHSRKAMAKHRAMCDAPGCGKTIHGARYKCVHPSCKDFDLCADCEALPIPVHPIDHPLLKLKTPKAIVPQVLREGQEIREKMEPVIPVLPVERNFPLPQIPILQPLPVHLGTIRVPVIPPRPPLPVPVPVPIRIDSSAQTTEVSRVSTSTQTVRKRRSVASVQTGNHGEEKSIQVEASTPLAAPRVIRIPIVEEEPKREHESPKIIVLPSVPTTEPVAPKPAAVPVPIPPRPDPISVKIPVVLHAMSPTFVKVPAPEAVPSPIVPRPPSPSVIIQTPSPAPESVPATPLFASEPEMTQTITQPASLYSNFIAGRPALEPIALSAAFVEDMNVADGTAFPPGAEFIKCWKMINDGRRDWPAETTLVFVGGHRMAAFADAPKSYDVGKAAVGQTVDVWAGDLKAPEEPGVYNSIWRLRSGENGEFFGHRVSFFGFQTHGCCD
jgi:next to BRCA1 gene 1 protein